MRFNSTTSAIKPLTIAAAAIIAMGAMSTSANAKRFFSDTSISVLYGDNYKTGPAGVKQEITTVTLEHASAFDWGGLFFFVDRLQGNEDVSGSRSKDIYGEVAPKFKISDYSNSFIKQVNLAGQYEFGTSESGFEQDNFLVGIGADLNIPIDGMKYASASIYHAFNDDTFSDADDQQITLTYGWEKNNFVVDGYIDYSFNNDDKADQLHINPQIKYNLQDALGIDNRIEVGMEYSYWKNKFGFDGVDQSVPSALVKFHF
ncbi:DUF5020 domain-containing protein [Psychrobacter sp. FBL11]|uniref:DUF5020 domain-containing protein n=1 Tax=Psychrobacter saeujeotis TaxID=3143436 RepID=A0ABU9X7N7_9GAMM|nr:DUF5020 domain-containing protein [uncultured Psychrobacter sp.]